MKAVNKRKIYRIPFKIKVVEEYLKSELSVVETAHKYNITTYFGQGYEKCTILTKWIKLYKEGKLSLDNTIAVSHREVTHKVSNKIVDKINTSSESHTSTLKAQTIVINGKVWVEYNKPLEVMNINGVDYVQQDNV